MQHNKINDIFRHDLEALANRQPLKGNEQVFCGIIPAKDGLGPRFLLSGHGKKNFLRMNSNSYLGLSLHPEVIAAEEAATRTFGTGPGAVRFISGTYQSHIDLENALARFHNRQASILFSSAYSTVVGILPSLTTEATVIISDELNHNSIINALRLARPAAKAIYSHCNMAELEKWLTSPADGVRRALVVTDGIFSMRGDYAPLAEISSLCRRHEHLYEEGILFIVDDSHGVGVFGKTGRGTEEHTNAEADILIGTLGKAFGVNGGYAAGSDAVIRLLREKAPLYIYSNPITVSEAAAALKALEIVDSHEGLRLLQNVKELAGRFDKGMNTLGFETIPGEHPIVPLMLRDTKTTTALCTHLFERGILATGLNYPVVPKGDEEIRFQIAANHTDNDIDYVLDVLMHFPRRK